MISWYRSTRPAESKSRKPSKKLCEWEAVPRAGQAIWFFVPKLGRWLKGATSVIPEDIQLFAYPVLSAIAFPAFSEAEAGKNSTPTWLSPNILEAHSIHESKVISKSSDSTTWKLGPRSSAAAEAWRFIGEKDWDRIGVLSSIDTTNLEDDPKRIDWK